ncbi:DUF2119 domain-containing protein [Methanolobus chelungpuianus]|uniref:DUF2119 domain-containing protein n=1 Tax=Methanolobus chelungpuianus TaxID=502115 RepID=A0AAE3HEF5_9EURY|nr:DUF2119 domain-containing protein [Methanolobus chelungpuianus]MCQ6963778.1 hypothetical protein [Methanolobus chelungpuianus]
MTYRILGNGEPVRLLVAGLHGSEWKDTSDILENIRAPKEGTLAVIPVVSKGNYVSTLDDTYFTGIGQPIIEAVEGLRPCIYIELHSYSAKNLAALTDPDRLNISGVPPFSRLDHDVLLGSVGPFIRRKYFPPQALCLTFEIQKDNSLSKLHASELIDIVKECISKEEFIRFMFGRYPKQAENVIRDYRNFYGMQDNLEMFMKKQVGRDRK